MVQEQYNFNVIRVLRKSKNLTLKELAHRAGMNYAILSRLERNNANITFQTLVKLSEALGIEPHELVEQARTQEPEIRTLEHAPEEGVQNIVLGNMALAYFKHGNKPVRLRGDNFSNQFKTMMVFRGKVNVEVEDETHELEAGDAINFDASSPHTYKFAPKSEGVIVFYHK